MSVHGWSETMSGVTDDSAVDQADPAAAASRIDHVSSAFVVLIAGFGLGLAASGGAVPLLVAVAIVQGSLILSWVFGTGLPGRVGAIVIGAAAAGGADATLSVWPHGQLGTVVAVVGLALAAMFVHQLTRGVVRLRVVESLSDIALMVVAVVGLSALVQLRHELDGNHTSAAVAFVIGAALVAGQCVDLVAPLPRFDPEVPRGLLAVVISGAVGALVGNLRLGSDVEFAAGRSLFLGAAVAVVAGLLAVGAGYVQHATSLPQTPRAIRLRSVFGALLPIGLCAPIGYLLCLAIHA